MSAIFTGLNGVGLFVEVSPPKYEESLSCYRREEKCADERGLTLKKRANFLEKVQKTNQEYPKCLHRENLIKAIKAQINEKVLPYLVQGSACKDSSVVILGNRQEMKDHLSLGRKDKLTILVKVQILDQITPAIAVLSTDFYRPDIGHGELYEKTFLDRTTAIPINLPEDKIEEMVLRHISYINISTREAHE
ncbi:MAG: hypothetical protein IH606_16750 [Burkholderiales bacterium]|nr:hypothetical protein [Burkholderiales bacterium]